MNIWITTIGNSDIQIKDKRNWINLGRKAQNRLRSSGYTNYSQPELNQIEKESDNTKKEYVFVSPSRILGIIYSQDVLDEESPITHHKYYDDLLFPLLDNFTSKLKDTQVKLDKIIYLLTDQENIFPENKRSKKCPYWQDTVTIKPILENYFKQNFPEIEQDYLELKPLSQSNDKESIGLDDWNNVLTLVQEQIAKISVNENDTVYVSHQAGTPAISSAIQFTTLARFGKQVKFLVSNEFNNQPASLIEGSNYLKGIQIQQAKQLINSGSPGGAKTLLKEVNCSNKKITDKLEHFINTFNIKSNSTDSDQDDFKVEVAIQRVLRSLELIEIYFEQENYLQGITLLAAAQETFMKAAIFYFLEKIKCIDLNKFNFSATEVFQWQNQGLMFLDDFFYDKDIKKEREKLNEARNKLNQLFEIKINKADRERLEKKLEILEILNFPVTGIDNEKDRNFNLRDKFLKNKLFDLKCVNDKNALYRWLKKLSDGQFSSWKLLDWSGQHKREFEDDKRNQIMHNLRGVEKKEVIEYLLGYDEELIDRSQKIKSGNLDVLYIYQEFVKKQFVKAIDDLKLPYQEEPKLKQQLKDLANELNSL